MSFISEIRRLYKNLKDSLRFANLACRIAARIDAEIQASNASDSLKNQSTSFVTTANALCAAIQAYIDALPGN